MKSADDKKNALRREALRRRDKLDIRERGSYSRIIAENVQKLPEYRSSANILIYNSTGSEVSTRELIVSAINEGRAVYIPRVTSNIDRRMEFVCVRKGDTLVYGSFGIMEPEDPAKSGALVYNGESDSILLVPGLMFDRKGWRLGYGGGFYDRYMARFPGAKRIALCFSPQLCEEGIGPVMDDHDLRMHALVTEKGYIRCQGDDD